MIEHAVVATLATGCVLARPRCRHSRRREWDATTVPEQPGSGQPNRRRAERGIANSDAIEALAGSINVDNGDSTRAATEMCAKLEEMLGRKVNVAAILPPPWHCPDGTAACLDRGANTKASP